jgi:hypothetical protein
MIRQEKNQKRDRIFAHRIFARVRHNDDRDYRAANTNQFWFNCELR